MTLRHATALGIRLVGLTLLLQIAVQLPQIIYYAVVLAPAGARDALMAPGTGISTFLFAHLGRILAGLVLFFRAAPISGWLLVDADPERRTPEIAGTQLFRCGIAVAGLTIAALALPSLAGIMVEMRGAGPQEWVRAVKPVDYQAQALTQIMRVLLGGVLVRQADAIARSLGGFWRDRSPDENAFD